MQLELTISLWLWKSKLVEESRQATTSSAWRTMSIGDLSASALLLWASFLSLMPCGAFYVMIGAKSRVAKNMLSAVTTNLATPTLRVNRSWGCIFESQLRKYVWRSKMALHVHCRVPVYIMWTRTLAWITFARNTPATRVAVATSVRSSTMRIQVPPPCRRHSNSRF